MPLPFEQDALALLEACAMALLPLNAPAQGHAGSHAAASPFGEALRTARWQHTPGGSALVTKATEAPAQLQQAALSFVTLPPRTTTLSAEQLSKTIERDARRFD